MDQQINEHRVDDPTPENPQFDESQKTKCQLSKDFSSDVNSMRPIREKLKGLFGIAQFPELGDDTFILKDPTTNEKENRRILYRRVKRYKNSFLNLVDCTADLQASLDLEEKELAANPYKVKGKYLGKGIVQAVVGLGFLGLLIYDLKNIINGGWISREALFTKQAAHDGLMKSAAYTTLIGGSIWGLKNGLSNIYKWYNLEDELSQARHNTDDNLVCLKQIVEYRKIVRSELPANEKTPKNKKKKKVTLNTPDQKREKE